jgi:head-tail adaptor
MIRPVGGFGRQRTGRSFAAGGTVVNGKMPRGRFDRPVVIVTPVQPTTTDDWNEATGPEPTRVDAWAAIRSAPGTERFQSAENAALAPMRFFFRWRDGLVSPTSVIEYDGRTFDVKSVEEIGRRELWQVIAVAKADEPASG